MMNHKDEKMDEEKSFEVIQEGVQKQFDNQPHLVRRGLTEVSAMFDRTGKGYLDETERALRRMDSQDRGYLGIDKVCVIFESLQAEQERSSQLLEALRTESKKSLNLKKGVIALSVFTILLALANVGTSFAIAKMVKDTSVSQGDLLDKNTGIRLGTTPKMMVFEMQSIENADEGTRRRLNDIAGLVCETTAETITNSDGSSSYTEKECAVQGTISMSVADDIFAQAVAQDRVVLTCNLQRSVIKGNKDLPLGRPGNKVFGAPPYEMTYKVYPTALNLNEKYEAVQRVFVSSQPAQNGRSMQRSFYCDAVYELAMYCPTELINGKQQECLVMTAYLPTPQCPTLPVVCGPKAQTWDYIN